MGWFILHNPMSRKLLVAVGAFEIAVRAIFQNSIGITFYEKSVRSFSVFIQKRVAFGTVNLYYEDVRVDTHYVIKPFGVSLRA